MAKFFLLSIIIAIMSLPARAARLEDPREGLRRALINVAIFDVLYMVGLKWLYGKSGATHAVYMLCIVLLFRYLGRRDKKLVQAKKPGVAQ
ncbi:MAG TPA: hypothetical protein VJV79_34170 [Polyangiaceae bacterium]|nr:hypothetical protein [Polyangiaceae bacterium]